MMPLSQAVMLDMYPPKQIPQVMAIWSSAVILGPIIGPAIGGYLTENFSWRWVFYINVPIGVLAFAGLYIFMDKDEGGRQRPFDFLGFGALVCFIAGLQLMLDRGPSQDWFSSKEIWIEATMAAVGLWVFLIQTFTTEHPFFHRDLAKDRNYVTTTIFGFLTGALLFSSSALLPSMMQNLLGYSALQSGYASMPRGIGSLVAFLSVPMLLQRFGPRPVLFAGLCISTVALWQMSRFDLSMTAQPIMISGMVQGLGTGLLFAPLNTLAYASLSPVHRTEGTVLSTMIRNLGSAVGISVLEAGLINRHGDGPLGAGRTRPAQQSRLQCGQPGLHEPRRPARGGDPQRRGNAPGGYDRLQLHVRLDGLRGVLHVPAAAPAAPPARSAVAHPVEAMD